MISAMAEYTELGGNFICGDMGTVISLNTDSSNNIVGVTTADGTLHRARKVVLCTGAYTPQIINTSSQIHPMGFCVAHWKLDADEMQVWKDHPVVDLHRHGYFFPPNEDGLMKIG